MQLTDVNVLVYAHREDTPRHPEYLAWVKGMLGAPRAFGVSEQVLSGFIRVVTHPRIFDPPSPLETALSFVEQIRLQPNCVVLAPGVRHWDLFCDLCRTGGAKGNLVPDAYLAALAIESGSDLVTTDRDFARFPDLRCTHPLAD